MGSTLNGTWLLVLDADGSPRHQIRCSNNADRNSRADDFREAEPGVRLLAVDVYGDGEIRASVPWHARDRQG